MAEVIVSVWREAGDNSVPHRVVILDGGELDPLSLMCDCGWETDPIRTSDGSSLTPTDLMVISEAHTGGAL